MGTQAVVARPTEGGGFAGRVVLHDGDPRTAVWVLRSVVHHMVDDDVEAAARLLIDEHPGGWVDLPDADTAGECLCHSSVEIIGGSASTELITPDSAHEAQYVYVLHPDRLQVLAPGDSGWEEIRSTFWKD